MLEIQQFIKDAPGKLIGPLGDRLIALEIRVVAMQLDKFPKGTVDGLLKHLGKEVQETRENPLDDHEWGDLQILLIAAAWRRGITPWQLIQFAHDKMDLNEKRHWPAEPDADGIYHHHEPKETK